MDLATNLVPMVVLLISLSVASERFVEIIKGAIPFLNQSQDDPKKEGWRRSIVQALGVVSGIVTSLLAWPAISGIVHGPWNTFPVVIALGLLASGGSGFWNTILSYLLQVKDIKELMAEKMGEEALERKVRAKAAGGIK